MWRLGRTDERPEALPFLVVELGEDRVQDLLVLRVRSRVWLSRPLSHRAGRDAEPIRETLDGQPHRSAQSGRARPGPLLDHRHD